LSSSFATQAIVCASAFLLASSLGAAAAEGQDAAPVTIESCTMSANAIVQDPERAGPRTPSIDGLTIVYSNDRDVAATEIHVRARYRGRTFNLVDRAAVSPRTKATHLFRSLSGIFAGTQADCSPVSVVFSDGSRWDAPAELTSPTPSP
jgi:hypothetical protein